MGLMLFVTLLVCASYCSEPLSIGQRVRIPSRVLKRSTSLRISKPDGYNEDTKHYPVLYLLDAESNFEFTTATVHFLADNDRIPEMIVVGVDSGEVGQRTHDLTPATQSEIENRFSPGNGGADAFLQFMREAVSDSATASENLRLESNVPAGP